MNIVKIYTLSDPNTNEVRYVGKTINPLKQRLKEHIRCRNKTYCKNWIDSLNITPVIELVDEVDNNKWEFWESFYIDLFKSFGFRLTNLTSGGAGAINYRRTVQDNKSIEKVVYQYDLQGNFIRKWSSMTSINKSLKYSISEISVCCNKKQKYAYNYQWSFIREKLSEVSKERKLYSTSRRIIQKTLDNKVIKIWNSLIEIEKELGFYSTNILKCCKGLQQKGYKYKWEFQNVL